MAMLPALADGRAAAERAPAAAGAEGALSQLAADSAVRRRVEEDAARACTPPKKLPSKNSALAIRDACRQGRRERGREALRHRWPMPRSKRPSTLCSRRCRTTSTSIASCSPTARYGLVELLGHEYAYTILRQCVRFCVDSRAGALKRHKRPESPIRALMPKLLDQYKLAGKTPGTRDPGDAAVEELAAHDLQGPPDKLGRSRRRGAGRRDQPEVVGEAISLASNLLVLRQGTDQWRTHGDSAGVHSSDATNAFRNMARNADAARDRRADRRGLSRRHSSAVQRRGLSDRRTSRRRSRRPTPTGLLAEAEDAVRHNDQGRAAAAIADLRRSRGIPPDGVFQTHAQVHDQRRRPPARREVLPHRAEEFRTTRPAFRWRQIVGLARVTASAYGYDREDKHGFRAPGYEDACKLLKVTA